MSLNNYLKETQYDEAGRVVSRTMGNDVSQIYDFNDWETAGGRLDTFTTGPIIDPLLNIAYGFDEVGNITGLTYSSNNLTESRIYNYDELNRLRTVTIGGLVTESVSYDPDNGNIDYKDGVEYGYDSIQPHAVNKLDSVQKYTYDANGSMTSRTVDGTTYEMDYDPENHLTSISGGNLTARYVFDGDGRRVLSVVGDTRTLYVNAYFEIEMVNNAKVNQDLTIEDVNICENRYCSFMPLAISDIEVIGMAIGNFGTRTFITEIMEPDNVNVTWRIYYPGGGLRVQTASTDNLSYLVQDHINSTAMTLNNSGAVTGEIIYSAWGETRATYGTTPTKKLYTRQYEAEAGLYFYNARWFDNELGRFAQADPIIPDSLDPQSWNRYTYGYNNPSRYFDPSGHIACEGFNECNSGGDFEYEPIIEFELIADFLQAEKWKWVELTSTYQQILEKTGWNQTSFDQSEYAGFGIRDIGGEIPEDPLTDIILVYIFGRIGYSALTPLSEYFCLNDGNCGNELEILDHALERMELRGVSIDQLNSTLQQPPFTYFHDGLRKLGYFDPISKIFVGVYDGVILTVMNNVKIQYIINLLSKGTR